MQYKPHSIRRADLNWICKDVYLILAEREERRVKAEVAALAMPRRWRTVLKKQQAEKIPW
jgi:hypothetical protein